MRMPFRIVALFAMPVALVANGQDYSERVDVRVIEVPVNVLDGSGNAVPDLTIDDFELRVNGRPQSVEYFDVLDLGAGPVTEADESVESTTRPRIERRILLLVDTIFSGYRGVFRGVDAAASYLERAHPDELIAIAAYRSGRVEYLTPFTKDRPLAYRAIRTLSTASPEDPLRLTIDPQARAALQTIFDDSVGGPGDFGSDDPASSTGDDWLGFNPLGSDDIGIFGPTGSVYDTDTSRIVNEMHEDQGRRHIREQIETLQGVARDLASLSGQKQLLFISQGFPSRLVMTDNALWKTLREMQKEFRQHGVIIHTVNTATVGPTLTTNRGQALFNIAYETGGIAFANSNRLDKHFSRFERSQQVTYLLAFNVPDDADPGYNDIGVRVADPRADRVIARPGFYGVTGEVEESEAALSLQLAEAVLGGEPRSDIRLQISASSAAEGFETIELQIRAVDLMAVENPERIEADVLIYILERGSVREMKSRHLTIDLFELRVSLLGQGQSLETATLGTRETFDLPPGNYIARVVFRILPDNLIAVASADLNVEE